MKNYTIQSSGVQSQIGPDIWQALPHTLSKNAMSHPTRSYPIRNIMPNTSSLPKPTPSTSLIIPQKIPPPIPPLRIIIQIAHTTPQARLQLLRMPPKQPHHRPPTHARKHRPAIPPHHPLHPLPPLLPDPQHLNDCIKHPRPPRPHMPVPGLQCGGARRARRDG